MVATYDRLWCSSPGKRGYRKPEVLELDLSGNQACERRKMVALSSEPSQQGSSMWKSEKSQTMQSPVEACCSSPAAICYWFMVSLIAWGVLSLIGIYWRPLHAPSEAACLFAMAVGCLANWLKNRSYHCAITGPLFLIAGVAFFLVGAQVIHVNTFLVWRFVLIGIGVAFLMEWRYAKRSAS
jgi:hypothetical protein